MGVSPNILPNRKLFKHYFGIEDYNLNSFTTQLYSCNLPNLKEFRTYKNGEGGIKTKKYWDKMGRYDTTQVNFLVDTEVS